MACTSDKKVIFLYIQDQYNCGQKLNCTFKLVNYEPFEGDRVAIYKSGFSSIKDYVLFEWVSSDARNQSSVTFIDHFNINDSDFYQFCYISGDNEVLGASKLFQFVYDVERELNGKHLNSKFVYDVGRNQEGKFCKYLKGENCSEWVKKNDIFPPYLGTDCFNEEEKCCNSSVHKEVKELREENLALKTAIRVLAKPDNSELKHVTNIMHYLYKLLHKQDQEIDMLKSKLSKLEIVTSKMEQGMPNKMNKSSSSSGNSSLLSDISLTHFDLEIENIPPCPL